MTTGEQETFRTARHECGHALVCFLLDGTFRYVTLRTRVRATAKVYRVRCPTARQLAVVLWAGRFAGGPDDDGWCGDLLALDELRDEVPDALETEPGSPATEAATTVEDYADALDFLAARLVERKTLTQREFLLALADWSRAQRLALAALSTP